MQSMNVILFEMLGAGFSPDLFWLEAARLVTAATGWMIAAMLAWIAWRHPARRLEIALGLACAGCATPLAQALAASLNFPRPFMLGLSAEYLSHGWRGGLPSTHASAMTALATFLLLRPHLFAMGVVTAALMLATGWARIYLGVHFPLDIVGGIALGGLIGSAAALVLAAYRQRTYSLSI